jgi:hypothetical protein
VTVEENKNELLIRLSETGRFWSGKVEDLTPPERVFRCVWSLESELDEGGFQGYYATEAGDMASSAVHALKSIGAHRAADIVREANQVFEGKVPPEDAKSRVAALDALDDKAIATLDRLDRDFYAYPDDLTELLFEYVHRHRVEIEGAEPLGI